MIAPHRIDIDAMDICSGFADVLRNRSETDTCTLPDGSQALITLSVRSAFDLYLRAIALPRGSEVIVSAITHPDMAAILRYHGLKPISVDLDFDSAAPAPREIRRAATASTRAVLIAHLFGALVQMDQIAAICRERGWLLLEDCAQAFGLGYQGHKYSDLTMFSFGPLKTATALGGGLAVVRSSDTLEEMAAIQATYPRQPRTAFVKRLARYALLRAASHRSLYTCGYHLLKLLGHNPAELVRGLTKSFAGSFEIERFRWRLGYPQIAFLKRRIASLILDRVRRRRQIGERLGEALGGVRRFGASGLNHSHWIFPITVADPEAAIKALAEQGISAMRGLSNLTVIEDRSDNRTPVARSVLAGSLLVPLPARADDDHIRRVARAVRSVDTRDRYSLRVATVNLWSGLDYQGLFYCGSYEGKAERERRYQHLVERLLELDADVITVNEANPVSRTMRRLARDLNYDEIHWRGLSGVRFGRIGLPFNLDEGDGILARRHLNLVPVGRQRLTGGWICRWGSVNFANATQVVCGRINAGGQPLYVFNTHWTIARTAAAYAVQATRRDTELSSFFESERVKAVKAYREASTIRLVEAERTTAAIQTMLPPGSLALLAGDFNAIPTSPEMRVIEDAGFIDVVSRLSPYAKVSTWNPSKNDVIQKFYGHSSHEDAVRVDYIFTNEMLVPALQRASVGLDGPSDRPHPSDHFALVCDLRLDRIATDFTDYQDRLDAYGVSNARYRPASATLPRVS